MSWQKDEFGIYTLSLVAEVDHQQIKREMDALENRLRIEEAKMAQRSDERGSRVAG